VGGRVEDASWIDYTSNRNRCRSDVQCVKQRSMGQRRRVDGAAPPWRCCHHCADCCV